MFSLAGTINQLGPRLLPVMSSAALAPLCEIARSLPASITHWIDFECRLADPHSAIDLIVRVDRRERDVLAGQRLGSTFAAAGRTHPAWHRVAAFASAWADPQTIAARCAGGVWLEFDADGAPIARSSAILPRLFVDLAREAYASRCPADRLRAILGVAATLAGDPVPEWLHRGLARCLQSLPHDASVLSLGFPAHRHVRSVRVCVLGLADDQVCDYLRAAGWPGDGHDLRRHLESLADLTGQPGKSIGILHLDLDDHQRVLPGVGLEYPFARRPQVRGCLREAAFLERLVARGLCDCIRRNALLEWPGCSIETLPHEIWPSVVMRRVSHVKVVYRPRHAPLAKAYLCCSHAWCPTVLAARRDPTLFDRVDSAG